jgi:hypothetical protein
MSIHIGYPGGLEKARTDYQAKVDRAAGAAIERHVTAIPGHATTLARKVAESRDYLAAGAPDITPETYPRLWVEMQVYGRTAAESAHAILDKDRAWTVIENHIEEIRLSAKSAIRSAASISAMHAIAADAVDGLGEV